MMYLERNLIGFLCAALVLTISGISCSGSEPIGKEDPYALWKELPNEKMVFMSKADSP